MTRGSANNKVDSSIDFFLPVDFGDVSQIGDVWPSLGQYGARERLDFREHHRLPAEWLPRERCRLDAGKDAYIAKAQGDLLTANLQRFPVSGTPENPTESCRCGNSAARWLSTDLFQIVVFVLWGFAPTALHAYRATGLQCYTPARIGKQRGTRNGTPRHSLSLLLFSLERLLNLLIILIRPDLGTTACGRELGKLAIIGSWTTNLRAYKATRLSDYRATRKAACSHTYLLLLSVGECDSMFLKLSRRRLSSSSSWARASCPQTGRQDSYPYSDPSP